MVLRNAEREAAAEAITNAEKADIEEVMHTLAEVLGQSVTAMAARAPTFEGLLKQMQSPSGKRETAVAERLRRAYAVVTYIREHDRPSGGHESNEAIQRWFMGTNPALGYEAPIELLDERFPEIMHAAFYLVAGDYS